MTRCRECPPTLLRLFDAFQVVMKGESMAALLARATYNVGFMLTKTTGRGKVVAVHATIDTFIDWYATVETLRLTRRVRAGRESQQCS
jgi:hypothetical protein